MVEDSMEKNVKAPDEMARVEKAESKIEEQEKENLKDSDENNKEKGNIDVKDNKELKENIGSSPKGNDLEKSSGSDVKSAGDNNKPSDGEKKSTPVESAKGVGDIDNKVEGKKATEDKGDGEKKDEKKDKDKKVKKRSGPAKTEALVNGRDLRISTKHAVAICKFIRGKDIDKAIVKLNEVSLMKSAVPMKGEIPHRKGRIMSGRFPVKASGEFIKLLNSLRANAIVNEMEIEKFRIACMSNVASRPYKRFGRGKAKRSHVQVKLVPRVEIKVGIKR